MGIHPTVVGDISQRSAMDADSQGKVLKRNHARLRQYLDIQAVHPHLNEQGLLSDHEREILTNPFHTSQYKIDKLLEWLPRKGSDGLDRFIECLRRSSHDARGHGELADQLQRDRDNPSPDNWRWVPAPRLPVNGKGTVQVLFGLLFLLLSLLCGYKSQLQHLLAWSTHSVLLPEPCTPFLGRDREVSDLMRTLDVESDEVRVVSIVGPSGMGKSCLAAQVGHRLMDSGATVSYFDASLLSLDSLPDLILHSTGSAHERGNSTEKLLHWLRWEMRHPLVLILDNCDNNLHTTERVRLFLDLLFDNAAMTVKVLATGRKKIPFSDQMFEYQLEPLTFDSSCAVLRSVSERDLCARDCESITKLTGNTPLSLALVGSILKSPTADVSRVTSGLEKEMENKETDLGFDAELNACIRLSLKYLRNRLIKLGKYLSLFPGSFSLADACAVISSFISEDCALIERLRQSGLLLWTEGNHYHLRESVKKHFVRLREESGIKESEFWMEYLRYFSELLQSLSAKFQNRALRYEVEKQEMRLFLRKSVDQCREFPNLCLKVLHTLKVPIESQFLFSFYDKESLIQLLQSILSNIDSLVQRTDLASNRADAVDLYAYFTPKLIDINPTEEELIFETAQTWLEQHTDSYNSRPIRHFYLRLSGHYSRAGRLREEVHCHVRILQGVGKLSDCDVTTCNHSQVSEAYHSVGEHGLSAYFQELYIKHSNLTTVELAEALLRLHACQVGNSSEAEVTARKILDLYMNLTDGKSTQTSRHLALFHNISMVFRLHRWRDEAQRVEERLLASVREADYAKVRRENVRRTLFSLIESLFMAREYGAVSEVVQCALDTYSTETERTNMTGKLVALHLVLGIAELYKGRRRESINSLKIVIEHYYNDTNLFNHARDACNAMLSQTHTEPACFAIALREALIIARSIYDFVTSDTFDADQFSSYYIYEFPVLVPSLLLADNIADVPVGPYCIVFFLKWCLANLLHVFSFRFIVQVINKALILLKLALVFSAPSFSLFLMYGTVNFIKRVYRMLWIPVWSEEL